MEEKQYLEVLRLHQLYKTIPIKLEDFAFQHMLIEYSS